jgi:exodeoxyribonuclease V alpha subunit
MIILQSTGPHLIHYHGRSQRAQQVRNGWYDKRMNLEILVGSVERITYYNPENGYSVIRLQPERGQGRLLPAANREGLITVTGNLPELSPGEHLKLSGRWSTHPKHGLQFAAEVCEQTLPATISGIRRYLGSGLIKGIGPRLAERIVERFGEQTLEVIEKQPARLREVSDIGPKRQKQIVSAWGGAEAG